MTHARLAFPAAMLVALALPAAPARAAGALDACTGLVSTPHYTISSPGLWCVDRDLDSQTSYGTTTLRIAADNVVLDCGHHTLRSFAGRPSMSNHGILADGQNHVTVRNCNLEGFEFGITLRGSGAMLVEDNRVASSSRWGILVDSGGAVGSVVRRNLVVGMRNLNEETLPTYGIYATSQVDVLDNTVDGVATANDIASGVFGIHKAGPGGDIGGNRVRGIVPSGGKPAYAIYTTNLQHNAIRDNDLSGDGGANATGIRCGGAFNRARDNIVHGFPVALSGCGDAGGNDTTP